MADRGRDPTTFHLSDEDVTRRWKEIIIDLRPELREATDKWDALGEKYKSLGVRRST